MVAVSVSFTVLLPNISGANAILSCVVIWLGVIEEALLVIVTMGAEPGMRIDQFTTDI